MGMGSMLVVGITGRSGSGKSRVLDYYLSLGYPGVDGDDLSRQVCGPGSPCVAELVATFGRDILAPDGALRRAKLAQLAFATPKGNRALVAITHPYIQRACEELMSVSADRGARLFFIDGAMILGSPFEKQVDRLILVTSEHKLAVSRIILRDGISKTAAHQRLDAQQPEEKLRRAADHIIENNGSERALRARAGQVLRALLEEVALR